MLAAAALRRGTLRNRQVPVQRAWRPGIERVCHVSHLELRTCSQFSLRAVISKSCNLKDGRVA
eukprot:6172210-Pleurochrysis_carterae.AAC.1